MAQLTNPYMLYFDPSGIQKVAVYRLLNVNSGDTIDVSVQGSLLFKKVLAAVFTAASLEQAAVASVVGTVVTLTLVNMVSDTVVLVVEGLG